MIYLGNSELFAGIVHNYIALPCNYIDLFETFFKSLRHRELRNDKSGDWRANAV